jgi:hypothetical protein
MEIRSIELIPIFPQPGNINRVSRAVDCRQSSLLRPKGSNPYISNWKESITCHETTTGTYEAISANDPATLEGNSHKGQLIDIWL